MAILDTYKKVFASVISHVLLQPQRTHFCPSLNWHKVTEIYCAVLRLDLNIADLEEMKL